MKIFAKHSDKLLLILAIAFLVTMLLRLWVNRHPREATLPSIVFTIWESPMDEALRSLILEFKNTEEINVIINSIPYEELRQELFNPVSNSIDVFKGDVIALDPLWVSELLEKEIIESTPSPFLTSIIQNYNVLYYNIDLLKKAGFSRPPKSREEFQNYLRTLAKEGSGQGSSGGGSLALGLNSSRGIYDDVFPWIWSGGALLIENGKPVLTSRSVVESLSFLAALNSEGLIAPSAFSADSGKKLEDFTSGRSAFIIAPSSEIGFVRDRLGDGAFGVTSIPQPDNYAGRFFLSAGGWTSAVYSASVYKAEAKLFVDFLAEKVSFLSDKARWGNSVLPAADPINDLYLKVYDITIANELAQEFSGLPWSKLEGAFKEGLAVLFAGESTPAETAASIQKKWEAILE